MKHSLLYTCLFATLLLCSCSDKGMPSLKETYSLKDAKPFGSKVAYHIFCQMYPDKIININKKSFDRFRADTYADDYSLYMSISKNFLCSEEEANAIVDFVKEGHSFFISANNIDTLLLNKVACKQQPVNLMMLLNATEYSEGRASLAAHEQFVKDSFSYYYRSVQNAFEQWDSAHATVLGYNQVGQANFIVLFVGKGRLYLHCEPRLLSNYFLLTANNYLYMQQMMQWMRSRPGNVFWDDYYNKFNYKSSNAGKGSALDFLFKNPALSIAFWILIALGLLYILFNGKRRQRIIPVIPPVQNASIAYTQAIAGLYLAEKNNKLIAEKMITYFNEFVRSHYFISAQHARDIGLVSRKSGIPVEKVQALYSTMEAVQITEELSDFELLTLNDQIQYFHKNRN